MNRIGSLFQANSTKLRAALGKRAVAFVIAVAMILAFYLLSLTVSPGLASYVVSVPALVILIITALARVNDIDRTKVSKRWQARRMGLILVGGAAATLLSAPFSEVPAYPTWVGVMLVWGFALAWLTTPEMPPWWKYITGDYRIKEKKTRGD